MAEYNLGKVVGDNAYELWLAEGNIGTLEDFFQAYKGDTVIASELQLITGYDGTTDMQSGVSYVYEADATEVLFSLAASASGREGVYTLTIVVGDYAPTFAYPTLIWAGGEYALEAHNIYELIIKGNIVTTTIISTSNE